ncbi:MAG: M20/M25/M40 family metallo-hydrolase [Parasporobacterium sp.]|nr:M20/M25/M40 family metallo-hydrolase [Parasporobacterium sp.]
MNRYELLAGELRKRLHEIPESSMNEIKTRELLISFITENTGLEICDEGKWFYAACRSDGAPDGNSKSIAFRADFDAVTCEDGACRHLCGHDGHAAVLAAFAVWVWENKPPQDIFLIFQPGEESGKGAALCCGIFGKESIDEIYGFHNIPGKPIGSILLKPGTFACASVGLAITLTGAPAHAAYPEFGINPARAAADIIICISEEIRKPRRGMVLSTVIGIEMGSDHYGVSASEGILRLTVRAEYQDEYEELLGFIEQRVSDISVKTGLEYRIERFDAFPSTENHDRCLRKVEKAASAVGLPVINLQQPFRWSEDFGWYLKKVPGAFFGIGAGEKWPELHTADYEFNDEIIGSALAALMSISTSS